MLWFILLVIGALIFLYIIQKSGGFHFPWMQFYVQGKEAGFSFRDIHLLRRIAIKNRIKNPITLFWSVKTLDKCIRAEIVDYRSRGTEHSPASTMLLNTLFDYRTRVELNQPKYRTGLSNTKGITAGQNIKIVVQGDKPFITKVIEINNKYIAVAYPSDVQYSPEFSWKNQDIKAYFWRQEDAGYYFETRILGDYIHQQIPILHIKHVDNVKRVQKRSSVRRATQEKAIFFPLSSIVTANEIPQKTGGYRCKLMNISESGAAIIVGGKVKVGLAIKLQVALQNDTVVLCGIVKSVTVKKQSGVCILHVQAKPPSHKMRVLILTYVYQLLGDTPAGKRKVRLQKIREAEKKQESRDNESNPSKNTESSLAAE